MTKESNSFEVADYIVCCLTLCVSISIGICYALAGGRQKSSHEYHVGNRNLGVIPVMFSLMVTTQSSILIVGVPAEVYSYGTIASLAGVAMACAYLIGSRIIVPIVHPLKITSVNEYFELRYGSRHVQLFMTMLTALFWILYIGIITFGLATSITSIVGIPEWISILFVSCASMLYTSIGGIKAVVWTDVFQFLIMFTGLMAVLIQGSKTVGGGSEVLKVNSDGNRLAFWNFSVDPTARYTIWNVLIGNAIKLLAFPLQQSSAQRVACMPSIEKAHRMFYIMAPIVVLMFLLAGAQGLVAFAYYTMKRCDPLVSGNIKNSNQIVPDMVTEIFEDIPGMTGLFISGLMCATLSTVSSGFAALSSITLHDVIKLKYPKISETKGAIVSKIAVVLYGIVTTAMTFLIANVKGSLLKIAQVLMFIPMAPYSGIVLYSVFFTSATTAGALTGGVIALAFYVWVALGQTFSDLPGLNNPLSPAPIDMCNGNSSTPQNSSLTTAGHYNLTQTMMTTTSATNTNEFKIEGIENLYSISFNWFDVIAIILVIVIGLTVSKIVGAPREEDVDIKYVLSFWDQFFPCLPSKAKYYLSCCSNVSERRRKYLQEQRQTELEVPYALEEKKV